MKRVLHLVSTIFDGGGVSFSVWNTVRALRDYTNWQPAILAAKYPQLRPLRNFEEDLALNRRLLPIWQPLNGRFSLSFSYPPGYINTLKQMAAQSEVVHVHDLWMFPTLVGCMVLRSMRKPYILAPRGALEPWAFRYKGLKKRLVFELAERKNLDKAAFLQATSKMEEDSLQRLGLKARLAVIPNGLNPDAEDYFFHNKFVVPNRICLKSFKKTVLFASRLHPKKRVVELIRIFARLATHFSEWRLLIAGGEDLPGYERQVRNTIREHNIGGRVQLLGHLSGDTLWAAYRDADLFVLPTMSENFGNVVIESLAAGVPVITTKGAPWHELEVEDCGWWVDLDIENFSQAMRQAMGLPLPVLKEMGLRGQNLVLRKYTWKSIANSLSRLYDEVVVHDNR